MKHVFHRGDREGYSVSPGVWLHPEDNTIMIRQDTRSDNDPRLKFSMNPKVTQDFSLQKCDITNIPIQRLVHVALVLNNRILDVFINGKLRKSCEYKTPPINNEGELHITDDGGFSGFLGNLQYFNTTISPEKIFSIYAKGINDSGNLVNKLMNKIDDMKKCK